MGSGRHQAGFTLLEILFVLFVSGLMIAIVGPRFGARITDYERDYQRREIENSFRLLPRRARLLGRALELPRDLQISDLGDGQPVLSLATGWQIKIFPPLRISSLGACSEATLEITLEDSLRLKKYKVMELTCELVED